MLAWSGVAAHGVFFHDVTVLGYYRFLTAV